jgi:hypothetical protein
VGRALREPASQLLPLIAPERRAVQADNPGGRLSLDPIMPWRAHAHIPLSMSPTADVATME